MREAYPEANMDTRIATVADDLDALRGTPIQSVGSGTLRYVNATGELCIWSDLSVAAAADGVAYVPTFVSDTVAYQADPASVSGRFLVHSRGLATSAPMTGMYLPMRVATTANLAATLGDDDVTLLANANGALGTIDGVTVAVGDRVLVKNQTARSANGLYVIKSLGSVSTKFSLIRAADMYTGASVIPEAIVAVLLGAVNGGKVFTIATSTPVIIGTTAISFQLFSLASGAYTAVRAATTTNLSATLASDNVTLEADANGALGSVDGVSLAVGNRVLFKSQTAPAANGIYVLVSAGGVSSKFSFVRADDMYDGASVIPGAKVNVLEGTISAGRDYAVVATAPVTLGTSSITFRPMTQETSAALVSGTITLSNLWIATTSSVNIELTTPGGTMGARLKVAKTAGAGNGSVTITAVDTSGATVTTDTSTLYVKILT